MENCGRFVNNYYKPPQGLQHPTTIINVIIMPLH